MRNESMETMIHAILMFDLLPRMVLAPCLMVRPKSALVFWRLTAERLLRSFALRRGRTLVKTVDATGDTAATVLPQETVTTCFTIFGGADFAEAQNAECKKVQNFTQASCCVTKTRLWPSDTVEPLVLTIETVGVR